MDDPVRSPFVNNDELIGSLVMRVFDEKALDESSLDENSLRSRKALEIDEVEPDPNSVAVKRLESELNGLRTNYKRNNYKRIIQNNHSKQL